MRKNFCPTPGCPRPCRRGGIMCAHHWSMVPLDIQERIVSALEGLERGADVHAAKRALLDSCAEAGRIVRAKEAK